MSGIAILRRLLMKQAMKESAPFQHEGIMSISKTLSGNVDAKIKRWVESAKRQGQDIDKMGEQEIKYILELNKPKAPKVYSNEEAYEILNKFANRNKKGQVIEGSFGGGITDSVTETIAIIKSKKPIDAMKEANKVLKGEGRYKSLSKADRKKIVNDETVTDHIFERNIEPDPYDNPYDLDDFAKGGRAGSGLNYLLGEDDQNSRVPYSKGSRKESWTDKLTRWGGGPSVLAGELGFEGLHQIYNLLGMGGLYAEGGRTGFGLGGMSRRAFLKLMGGAAATGAAAKTGLFGLLKAGKPTIVKDLTSVPIGNAAGMPAWFKPLVNKVIKEGEDVTKKFATQERQIVHNKKLGKDEFADEITVTQELDTGNVRVEYHSGSNMGEAPIQLDYKAAEEIEPILAQHMDPKNPKGPWLSNKAQKTKPDFKAVEAEPEVVNWDGDIEWSGENLVDNVDDLLTDTNALKEYATGKVSSAKELHKSIKKQRYVNNLHDDQMEQINYIENKSGHLAPESLMDEPLPDKIKKASGGRVPFIFGGGAIKNVFRRLKDVKKIPHGEKVLKKNTDIQHLLSSGDKQQLKELETQFSEQILLMLKKDRELMLQLQSNKAMQDEGLDFLMKKMEEDFAPHIKKYKSIEEIDEAILNMENIIKNKAMKEGRRPHAIGGRVPLAEGTTPSDTQLEQYYRNLEEEKKRRRLQKELYEQRFGGPGPVLEAASGGIAGMLGE